jgi:hypothetical protein
MNSSDVHRLDAAFRGTVDKQSNSAGDRLRRDAEAATEAVLTQIRGVLQGLRFGSVTIIVQDGVVVQIDRTEKRRLQPNARRLDSSAGVGMTVELPAQRAKIVALAQDTSQQA